MRRLVAIGAVTALLLSACGGDGGTTTSPASTSTTTASTAPSSTEAETTTTAAPAPTTVLAVVSGRGDDQTFEVAVWLDGRVDQTESVLVGIDADDSYPGTGDLAPHLEGWARVGDTVEVGAFGQVVAGGNAAAVTHWVSFGSEGDSLRLFFIQDIAPIGGTVWVVVDEGSAPGAIAGVVAGQGCSVRGSVVMAEVSGEVPDPGVACRYPNAA